MRGASIIGTIHKQHTGRYECVSGNAQHLSLHIYGAVYVLVPVEAILFTNIGDICLFLHFLPSYSYINTS